MQPLSNKQLPTNKPPLPYITITTPKEHRLPFNSNSPSYAYLENSPQKTVKNKMQNELPLQSQPKIAKQFQSEGYIKTIPS